MRKVILFLLLLVITTSLFAQVDEGLSTAYADVNELDSLSVREVDSLSQYYESIGYYNQALEELSSLTDLTQAQKRRKANLCFRLDDLKQAKELLLSEILPIDTTFTDLNMLATIVQGEQDVSSAIYYRETIAEMYPYNASNLILLSSLYESTNSISDAMVYLDRYIEKYPLSVTIRRLHAINNYKLGEKEKSHEEFALLYDMEDDNPNTLYYYGSALILSDSIPKAEEVLKKGVLVTNYENPVMLLDYAYVLNAQKKYSQAHEMLERVDLLLNHSLEYLYNNLSMNRIRGSVYLAEKKYVEAAKAYEVALSLSPDDEKILYSLVLIEDKLGRKKNLERRIKQYLEVYSKIPKEDIDGPLMLRAKRVESKQMNLKEEAFMNNE